MEQIATLDYYFNPVAAAYFCFVQRFVHSLEKDVLHIASAKVSYAQAHRQGFDIIKFVSGS